MIRISMVDDHRLFLSGVKAELEGSVDVSVKKGPLAAMLDAVATELRKPENGGPGEPDEQVVSPR